MGQSVCPQCGSSAEVRTVAELFSMLNGGAGGAMQQGYPPQQTGPDYQGTYPDYPSQDYQAPSNQAPSNQGPDSSDASSEHPYQSYQGPGFPSQPYQAPSSGPAPGYQGPDYPNSQRRGPSVGNVFGDAFGGDPAQQIANTVLGAAFKFGGGRIGKRMQKVYEERIAPAMEAQAQARQKWMPSGDEQAAIVQRYPDLRGCMRDSVLFLDGGSRTVPISEIRMPVTLAQADAIVGRLQAP